MRLLTLVIAALISSCSTVQPAGPDRLGRWRVVHSSTDLTGVADAVVLITYWTSETLPAHSRTFCDSMEVTKTDSDGSFVVSARGARYSPLQRR